MSRWIDADALPRHGQRGGIVHWKDIEDAPSIDIVRCGECKWYNCGACFRDDGVNNSRNADDFCSYGSRSEKPNNSKERSSE